MKKLLLKTWLLLTCLLLGVGSAWATDVTFNPASDKTFPKDGITLSVTDGTLTNGTDYRVYKNQTMTISSTVGNITNIALTYSSASYDGGGWAASYQPNAVSWTSPTANGEQARITKLVVTVSSGGGTTPTTTYNVTIANNIENGTVSANPTSAAEGATVTLTATPSTGYEFGSWSVTDASSNAISVTDNKFTMPASNVNVSATFTAKLARPENEIFYESFDTNEGTGGNDGKWSGSIATNNIKSDNEWTFVSGNGACKCAKLGTGSALGSATTPALGQACNATLTFKAAAWNSNSENTTLKLSVVDGGSVSDATVTLKKGEWTEYTVTLSHLTAASKIKFEGNSTSNSRFFLDEVSIVKTGDATLSSIEVKTAPTKVTYTEGDMFEPAGLVITASYSDDTNEDVAYADHTSDFTFDPSLTTALATTNTSVTITYGGKTTTQAILVNAAEPNPEEGDGEKYNFSSFTQANDVTLEAVNFTITLHKNTGSTAPQWNGNSNEARVYAKGSVDVTSTKTISKIVYDYTINANSSGVSPTVDGAAGEANAGTWDAGTKTWTGKDKKVTLTTSGSAGNLGFKSITVYLEPEPATGGTITFKAQDKPGVYYATFSSEHAIKFDEVFINDDESCVAEIKAFAVSVIEGQLVLIDLYDDFNDGNYTYIPSNTGVLFRYTLEEDGIFDGVVPFEYADEKDEYLNKVSDNMLLPASAEKYDEFDGEYFMLSYDANGENLGFYWGADDGGKFNSRTGSAYLAVSNEDLTTAARGFSFSDYTEGIEKVMTEQTPTTIYTLDGMKVNELQKGLNIVNGKKIMVK